MIRISTKALGILALLALLVFGEQAGSQPAGKAIRLMIHEGMSPGPDPACAGQTIKAVFNVDLKAGDKEVEAFPGNLKVVSQAYKISAPGKNTTIVGIAIGSQSVAATPGKPATGEAGKFKVSIPADAKSAELTDATGKAPTTFEITVSFRGSQEGLVDVVMTGEVKLKEGAKELPPVKSAPSGIAVVRVVKGPAVVSPFPIVTGYEVDPKTQKFTKSLATKVTVRVCPNAKLDLSSKNVTFELFGVRDRKPSKEAEKEAEVRVVGQRTATLVNLEVLGKMATPANAPGQSDLKLFVFEKTDKGKFARGESPVEVIVPKAIGTPHPQFDGRVVGINRDLDKTTQPPIKAGIGPNEIGLVTLYVRPLRIPVIDQFGRHLQQPYVAASVSEEVTEKKGKKEVKSIVPINEIISGLGTYTDPTGVILTFKIVPKFITKGEMKVPNPEIANWVNNSAPLVPNEPVTVVTQNVPVFVAGHKLNPGVVNRRITFTQLEDGKVVNKLKIVWPN